MEQQIMNCPKCQKEISEIEYYKYHLRCKDCWNAYCKTHRYYNPKVQKRARDKFKVTHYTQRLCKNCQTVRPVDLFEPRKHYCKICSNSIKINATNNTITELKLIAKKAVQLNDSYNFDDVTDYRSFNF